MFEDLFKVVPSAPDAIGAPPTKEPVAKNGMFGGLFERPPEEGPPIEERLVLGLPTMREIPADITTGWKDIAKQFPGALKQTVQKAFPGFSDENLKRIFNREEDRYWRELPFTTKIRLFGGELGKNLLDVVKSYPKDAIQFIATPTIGAIEEITDTTLGEVKFPGKIGDWIGPMTGTRTQVESAKAAGFTENEAKLLAIGQQMARALPFVAVFGAPAYLEAIIRRPTTEVKYEVKIEIPQQKIANNILAKHGDKMLKTPSGVSKYGYKGWHAKIKGQPNKYVSVTETPYGRVARGFEVTDPVNQIWNKTYVKAEIPMPKGLTFPKENLVLPGFKDWMNFNPVKAHTRFLETALKDTITITKKVKVPLPEVAPPIPVPKVVPTVPPKVEVPPTEIKPEIRPEYHKVEGKTFFVSKTEAQDALTMFEKPEKLEVKLVDTKRGKFYVIVDKVKPEVPPVEKPPIVKPVVKAKLPAIKKPAPERGKMYGITIMPDPGLDKFIAEEVRPVFNKAMEAGKYLGKTGKHIPEFMMKIIEPAKLTGKELLAIATKGTYGKREAKLVEFDLKRLDTMDVNITELEKWFNKFPDKDLRNVMLSRGKPTSAEALTIQRDAIKETPKELKVSAVQKAIQEIADFNYKFLQEVAGKDIHKVEDYFYGKYKDPKMVSKFLDYWMSTERFIKKKIFPTAADAEAYGLELKHKNPVANLRAEFGAIAQLEAMNWMKEELLRTGKGIYIETTDKAPIKWDKVNDPVFDGLKVEPDLARLINNLIATNKITRIPVLNALRKINNTLRTYKFIGSAFHAVSIAKQSAVDSGYLGFAYKKTAVRGATFGFKEYDPIFKTPEYLEYIELGGGHKYSAEFQSKKIVTDFVDKVNRGNFLGAFTKVGIFPAKIPKGFVNWMFNRFIPKVKYAKYLDFVAKREKDLGRMITDGEKIEIIKEGQNFYGMMNERLFGRRGDVTTGLRFVFLAPGYAEGNYRTIIKSFSQWGIKGTYGAGRSRFNIVNSLILTAILATAGTLIFTKKWPKRPKKAEDIRDLFKVDTGYVDDKGRKVMIDLMTYDKDYWNVYFNVLRGRPDVAITQSVTRLGGMKAPTAEMLWDFSGMLMGNKIYDWKGNEVIELTDPFLIKLQKLAIHEIRRLEPISMSVYKQLRNKDVDRVFAFIAAAVGVRATKTEEDKRIQEVTSRIYSLKGQQEELYQYLGSINKPREAVERYNKMVNDVLDSKMVPAEMRAEWRPKLLIDLDRLLSNKVYQLTNPMLTLTDAEKEKEIARIKKYLNNFEVSMEEAEEQLKYYWKEHPVKDKWSDTHRANVKNRKARLEKRY